MSTVRKRAVAAGVAAVAFVVLAAQAPGWLAGRRDPVPATAVPVRVHTPWLWQATVGQHPVGPASVLFLTDRTRYGEATGVVVGRDGDYRLLPLQVGEEHGALSPDGRWYVRSGTGGLIDLRTGDEQRTHRRGLRPLTWSPDGRQLLATRTNDDAVITYGPDGAQLNDPAKPDDLVTVDPWSGVERVLTVGTFASHAAASWSPDGSLLAVAGPVDPGQEVAERHRLVVTDPAGGVRWQVDLAERRTLAGPAAWSPDGRRVALLAYDGCQVCTDTAELMRRAWRIEYLDAATGRPAGDAVPVAGSAAELVGWRGADPVLERHSPDADHERRHTALVAVTGGGEQVLLDSPGGVTDLVVPRDLLDRAAYGGPASRPSPFAAPPWLLALLVVSAGLLGTALHRWSARRRRLVVPARREPAHPG
ncbi:TolB family protein [Micromonospora sp. BQ11]|uniref:TolB family protein n=1 Tax=Micromonospora sp. BQ11 TaxID=3452212 RepID=UPI003F893058